jgi:hypothetical protein
MCEIIAFPNKKVISKEIEERLFQTARDYIDIVNDVLDDLGDEECERIGVTEVANMVAMVYAKGIETAIDDLDWDSD